ncbi:MAG TPA: acetate--CoA ligase, partial [Polyangiaceae bacterium]
MSDKTGIETYSAENRTFEPSPEFSAGARVKSRADYDKLYRESLDSPDTFYERETRDLVFRKPWHALCEWQLPHSKWFVGAELNVSESCLDRHLQTPTANKPALIWESEPGESVSLTYAELHSKVVEFAAVLRGLGVGKGDRVAIYMGMVPEVVIGMLACARVGAPHTVVFGGFAAESLRDRINDSGAKLVLTQDGALRRGNVVELKATVDRAVAGTTSVEKVIVYRRLGQERAPITMQAGRDLDWADAVRGANPELGRDAEIVDAEHPLFILYTSGSTGKPKGVLHTSAGYLVGTHLTTKYVFDLRPNDVYFCTADVGWITGHSYIVYGPLSNGATCVLYEGAPNQPDWGRFWQIIEKHQVTILYTAPTAIRAFIRAGDEWPAKSDLSSLRLLGSVGEPINPEAWIWYQRVIGGGRCPIVDTWWQTETGAIMISPVPGAVATKPGSCTLPLPGIDADIVDDQGQSVTRPDAGGYLVIRKPWPSMLRTLWRNNERYLAGYWEKYQ